MRAMLLLIAVVLVTQAGSASAAPAAKHPRCAIKNPTAPVMIKGDGRIGAKKQWYMWGEFLNRCVDPTLLMGSFACLQEYNYPGAEPKLVECYTNEDKAPFTLIAPHETNVFLLAKCEYTTFQRFYRVSGYGWTIALPTDGGQKYQSKQMFSPKFLPTANGEGDLHYCHLSAANTSWRSFRIR